MDHDRLFKELLSTFFAEFVDLFLPEVSAYLQRDTLQFLDKELFTDVTSGEKHEADLVVKARYRDQDAFFLIHVENQATPAELFGRRMFRYFARLHEKHGLPVYPVAIFSYDAPQRPEPDRYQVVFPDRKVLDFSFRVIQLNRLNWRDYVRQHNPVASALMARMRIALEERPKVKLECLRLLATLKLDPARMQLISGFVDSYLRLSAQEQKVFQQELQAVSPPEQEAVMEITTSWKEEGVKEGMHKGMEQGLQQGLQQGLHEGLQRGKEEIVLRLLNRRLGKVPDELRDRIHQLPASRLEELAEALLEFRTISDAQAWIAAHS